MSAKIIVIIVITAVVALLLAGCGGEVSTGTGSASGPTATVAVGGRSNPSAGTSVSMYMKLRTPTPTKAAFVADSATSAAAVGTPPATTPNTPAATKTAAETPVPVGSVVPPTGPRVTTTLKVGLVTDTDGAAGALAQPAWSGVQNAIKELQVDGKLLESKQTSDYEANISQLASEGYAVIITVGPSMGPATAAAAKQHPSVWFAIVGYEYPAEGGVDPYTKDLRNVASLMPEARQHRQHRSRFPEDRQEQHS